MQWIFAIIKDTMKDRFTGSIQIHFFKGGIANITKLETIKPPNKKETFRPHQSMAGGV